MPTGTTVQDAQGNDITVYDRTPLTIRTNLSQFEATIAAYPNEVKEDLVWLYNFRRHQFSDHTALLSEFIKNKMGFKMSEQLIYQWLAGKYFRIDPVTKKHTGSVDTVKEVVAACRQWAIINSDAGGLPFIEIPEWLDVQDYLDGIRMPERVCKFGAVVGHTGRGKSRMLRRYAMLNNHGTTIHIEASRTASLSRFQAKLGFAYGVPLNADTTERIEKIQQCVRADRTIIIDNVQKFYRPAHKTEQPILDYIQELQDETACTFILSWTPVFTQQMTDGRDAAYFEQFAGRLGGMDSIHEIAPYMPKRDLSFIVDHLKIPKAGEKIMKEWSRMPGRDRILYQRVQFSLQNAQDEGAKAIKISHLEAANNRYIPVVKTDEEDAA